MSSEGTPFIETEALLKAVRDSEVDSGVYEVDEYLDSKFMEGELRSLARAADVLSDRAWKAYQRKRAVPGAER